MPKRRHELQAEPPQMMTVKQAAELLGVWEMTLRRWDKAGKFRPHRHPVNGCRVYKRVAALKLRKPIQIGTAA